jgi:hypothetical protein
MTASRPCQVCLHPARAVIELAHVNGVSAVKLGKRHKVHPQSLRRHVANHCTDEHLRALKFQGFQDEGVDLESMRAAETRSLLANLIAERVRASRIADLSERRGDLQTSLRASSSVVHTLQKIAGLLGELPTGHVTNNITNNLLVSPQWAAIRQLIAGALRPYPEAQRAVVDALGRHERAELAALPMPAEPEAVEAEYVVAGD